MKGKIYLSGLNNTKNLNKNITKLFIALKPIDNMNKYNFIHAPGLAPSEDLFKKKKFGNMSWQSYVKQYRKEMLNMTKYLDQIEVLLQEGNDVALICYCPYSINCHRGILSHYFEELGYEIIDT